MKNKNKAEKQKRKINIIMEKLVSLVCVSALAKWLNGCVVVYFRHVFQAFICHVLSSILNQIFSLRKHKSTHSRNVFYVADVVRLGNSFTNIT